MVSRRWRGTTVTSSISARKDTSAWVRPGGRGSAIVFFVLFLRVVVWCGVVFGCVTSSWLWVCRVLVCSGAESRCLASESRWKVENAGQKVN